LKSEWTSDRPFIISLKKLDRAKPGTSAQKQTTGATNHRRVVVSKE
jgi:hypothetical protein